MVGDHTVGSLNKVIQFVVEVDSQEEAEYDRVGWCNLAAMTDEDVEAAEKLWMELVKKWAHLDAECTADEVEQETAWCQESMGSILDTIEMRIWICANSKVWCNGEYKDRWKAVRGETLRRKHSRRPQPQKHSCRGRFESPRGKCRLSTCKSSGGLRYKKQQDTRTLRQAWPCRP